VSDPRYDIYCLLQQDYTIKEIAKELALNINLVKRLINQNNFRSD
jgi:DNA-binding CsgD family transcriptional regulator